MVTGEELSIAYTELYANRGERRSALEKSKHFTCRCTRCLDLESDARVEGYLVQSGIGPEEGIGNI